MFLVSEKDQFLKTLGRRISDTNMMKDVCLEMGMKGHHIESHLTNYPKNINEAAYEAFSEWWRVNTARNKSEGDLLTTLKAVCKFFTTESLQVFCMQYVDLVVQLQT